MSAISSNFSGSGVSLPGKTGKMPRSRSGRTHVFSWSNQFVLTLEFIKTMSSIEERVKKIVAEQLGVKEEDVQQTSSFVEDLGADSLDTVELVMALEEEFETEIPDEEAEKITTV